MLLPLNVEVCSAGLRVASSFVAVILSTATSQGVWVLKLLSCSKESYGIQRGFEVNWSGRSVAPYQD